MFLQNKVFQSTEAFLLYGKNVAVKTLNYRDYSLWFYMNVYVLFYRSKIVAMIKWSVWTATY